jgi:hypothetical protein
MVTLPCSRATLHRVLLNAPRALLEYLSEVGEDGLRCCLVTEVLAFGLLGLRSLRLPEEREAMARELLSGGDLDVAPRRPRPAPRAGAPVSAAGEGPVSGNRERGGSGAERLVVTLLRERVDRAFGFTAPAGSGRVRFLVPRPLRGDRSG